MIREWDIKRTTFSFGDFLSWQKTNGLQLSPSFQRRSVWTKAQKSYFVDTVYRGLPVPILFLRERTDVETLSTLREVIDGQQRLRTLLSYVDLSCLPDSGERDDFTVQNKHNPEIQGKPFSDLTAAQKRRILAYQFSVHVLPNDTSDSEVLSIFARMNSTGSKLNDQELRNANYFGEFKILSYDLAHANLNRWRQWSIFSELDIAKMKEVEFTSSLLITALDGLFEKTQPNIEKYYKLHDESFPRKETASARFNSTMGAIESYFGEIISSSVFSNSSMFLQLFYLVMTLDDNNIALTRARARLIISLGEKIKNREGLPETVNLALAGRLNRLSNMNAVAEYLYKHASV